MDKLLYKQGEEIHEITMNEYLKSLQKELEIKPIEVDGETIPADMIMKHVWKVNDKGQDPEESIKKVYPELFTRVEQDFKTSKELQDNSKKKAEDEKAAEKAKKEEEKKAAEEAEKLILKKQEELAPSLKAGADTAASEFKAHLQSVGESLPEGVKLVLAEGGEGFALAIGENVSDETLVQGMGYLLQSSLQNEFMAGVYQFSIGDMVQALTKRGIYRTGKEAGEHIGKLLADSGKKLHPSMIAQYARMSERIPAEKRNPKVMPTAYLELANIPLAKKGEKETDAEFKTRVAELNKEKDELLDKLAAGEITDRKDVTEKVKTIKENAGLIKKADTSFSLSDSLKEFFFLMTTKNHFMDIHEEGVARFKEGDKVFDLTEAEVTERLDNVESQLRNYYFTKKGKNPITFKDIVEGKREVVTKGGQIDAKGKKSDKIDVVEIYPEPFWNTEEQQSEDAEEAPAKEEAKEATATA